MQSLWEINQCTPGVGAKILCLSFLISHEAEDKLFHKILGDTNPVLFQLLPDQRGELIYSLRK